PTEKPEAFTNGTELEIRLVGGYTKYEGNVEVFHNATWGGICDDYWSELHAQIVCSMLGFQKSNALAIKNNSFLDTSYTPFWLDDVKCPSNATILWHCTHRAWGSNDCNRGEKAGVKCYP
ncbi:galectin-3-binding protein A, partial [Biomphalaria glabrata]